MDTVAVAERDFEQTRTFDNECHREPETLKLQKLYDYLKNNEAYLVNYEEREQQEQTIHQPSR